MVVGMVYARSVNLPQIASYAKPREIQLESRVQRFERVLRCPKLIPLEALKPISKRVLETVCRSENESLMILMDRSMINDTLNLLWISVGFQGRALPLGWVLVPHEGNSDLALQQEILSWVKEILPEKVQAVIVADREFHSIRLAEWIEKELKLDYVLRIRSGTYIEFDGELLKTSEIAASGESFQLTDVKITKDAKVEYRTNLTVHWEEEEEEAWVLAANLELAESIIIYRKRFWIEEMFSDHKSRGLNLEKTRLKDADRIQRLLIAVTLAYLWLMEIGFSVVVEGNAKQVDNKGLERSVSLCQIGLRWLRELLNDGLSPPLFTANFETTERA
jgi:transposase